MIKKNGKKQHRGITQPDFFLKEAAVKDGENSAKMPVAEYTKGCFLGAFMIF